MISYELALKLKEAGFPQQDRHFYYCTFTFPETLWCINALEQKKLDHEYDCMFASPTLSELIEACGDKFDSLIRCGLNYKSAKAIRDIETHQRIPGGFEASTVEDDRYTWEWGSSPEEAVANLYLVLHKSE